MGFNEDERIRRKNLIHNEAYFRYARTKKAGFSNLDILSEAEMSLIHVSDESEIKILNAVISIARSSHENSKCSDS